MLSALESVAVVGVRWTACAVSLGALCCGFGVMGMEPRVFDWFMLCFTLHVAQLGYERWTAPPPPPQLQEQRQQQEEEKQRWRRRLRNAPSRRNGAASDISDLGSFGGGGGGGGGGTSAAPQSATAAYLRVAEGALSKAAAALDPLSAGFRQHAVSQGVTVFLKDAGPLTYALGQAVLPVPPWVAMGAMTDPANKARVDPSFKRDTLLEALPAAVLDRAGPAASSSLPSASGRVGVSCGVYRTEMKPVLMTGARDLVTVLSCCYDRDCGAVFRVAASVAHAEAPVDAGYVRAQCFCVGFAMQRATAAAPPASGLRTPSSRRRRRRRRSTTTSGSRSWATTRARRCRRAPPRARPPRSVVTS